MTITVGATITLPGETTPVLVDAVSVLDQLVAVDVHDPDIWMSARTVVLDTAELEAVG